MTEWRGEEKKKRPLHILLIPIQGQSEAGPNPEI